MNGYFDELAVLLRERGVPAERVASTIEELSAFAEEGSGDPEEEFGPVAAFAEQLAPDGWEPCGTWFQYAYFKRPGAASVGPAAELHAPPPAPERRTFFSRRFYLLVAAVVALCVLAVVLIGISLVKGGVDGTGFVIGAAVGAAGVLVAFWLTVRRQTR
ncbi:hypothetical protein [Nonomuraea sp. NPDC046570]|uniref:hypothetical protein n=1 Tax=Nonomuraea sp. NPDC046570 TaxID=3155255 RepID=UPI003407753F